jgi:hypothetical protein
VLGEQVENVYRLQVMNTTERRLSYEVGAQGIDGLHVASEPRFDVDPASTQSVVLRLQAPRDTVPAGSNRIHILVRSLDDAKIRVSEKSVFFGLHP